MRTDFSRHLPVKPVDLLVLMALAQEDLHGYGLVQSIAKQSEGQVNLVASNLYTVLRRLEAVGLIDASGHRPIPGREDQRRRYYQITSLGTAVVRAEALRLHRLLQVASQLAIFDQPGS